jgi:hypothetical protein
MLGFLLAIVLYVEPPLIVIMVVGTKTTFDGTGDPHSSRLLSNVPTTNTLSSPLLSPEEAEEAHLVLYIFFMPTSLKPPVTAQNEPSGPKSRNGPILL